MTRKRLLVVLRKAVSFESGLFIVYFRQMLVFGAQLEISLT